MAPYLLFGILVHHQFFGASLSELHVEIMATRTFCFHYVKRYVTTKTTTDVLLLY